MIELNEFQYNTLLGAVQSGNQAIMFVQPEKTASTSLKTEYKENLEHLKSLVDSQMLEDISTKFADRIKFLEESQGRACHIFKLTDTAWKLFEGSEEREVN